MPGTYGLSHAPSGSPPSKVPIIRLTKDRPVRFCLQSTVTADPVDALAAGLDPKVRFVGKVRVFHRSRSGRWIDCQVIACPRCSFGLRPRVLLEIPVLVGTADGKLTPARIFVPRKAGAQLAELADRHIDARGRDPKDVPLVLRYKGTSGRVQEILLEADVVEEEVSDDLDDVDLPLSPTAGSAVLETAREVSRPVREASRPASVVLERSDGFAISRGPMQSVALTDPVRPPQHQEFPKRTTPDGVVVDQGADDKVAVVATTPRIVTDEMYGTIAKALNDEQGMSELAPMTEGFLDKAVGYVQSLWRDPELQRRTMRMLESIVEVRGLKVESLKHGR